MSDQLNTSPEMCIYWHDQTIKANHKVAELEAKVAELDRFNTDLAMESHGLQAKVAELEALVREVYRVEPRWGEYALMVERECDEWLKDARRLCPPAPQEDA